MADVARRAAVSGQTVSRVVNGHPNISPSTRKRVLDAIAALGYRPNSAARALRSGHFHKIGVIISSLTTYGSTATLTAIASEAAAAGYALVLVTLNLPSQATVGGALRRLREHAVDGIVVLLPTYRGDDSDGDFAVSVPLIFIDSSPHAGRLVIDSDQTQGAAAATQHLLELGHHQVHHLAGPRQFHSARVREAAWRATLRRAGKTVPEPVRGDWSADSGYRAGALLASQRISAVFAANDQMALGLIRALVEGGRRIPEDVSVVGFDDGPGAAHFWPPLTTVHQDLSAMGVLAVQRLLRLIDGAPQVEEFIAVQTGLVLRGSTTAPVNRASGR